MNIRRRTILRMPLPLFSGDLVQVRANRFLPKRFHGKIGKVATIDKGICEVDFYYRETNIKEKKVKRTRTVPVYKKGDLEKYRSMQSMGLAVSTYGGASAMCMPAVAYGSGGGGGYGGGAYQILPTGYKNESYMDIERTYDEEIIDWRENRLFDDAGTFSENFKATDLDYFVDETENPKKKGGVLRKMPRIFRYAIYAALVVLVWKFVTNIEVITAFAAHLFVSGVK